MQKVRQQLPALQGALHADVVVSRREARTMGRQRLEDELEQTLQATGSLVADDAAAVVASSTLAGAWGAAALATIASDASPRELAQLTRIVDGRVRRTAVTETALAFNDERHALLIDFDITGEGGRGSFDTEGALPKPGMFKVWSAVLDRVTCPRCFAADGEVVELKKAFKGGAPPPLHPHCRCVVEHVIVPKPERIEDIAIDYELFKEELRDIIRENREISDRRALAFVSDSLGDKRSPAALTKRFAREDYATREPTVAGGRITLVKPRR